MSDLIPIVNTAENLYVQGLQTLTNLNFAPFGPGIVFINKGVCRDSTDTFDIVLNDQTILDPTVNGANGLDTGTLAANTLYYVFAVMDPTNALPSATVMSLSETVPLMPTVRGVTYSAYRLIDHVLTDSSAKLLAITNYGNDKNRYKEFASRLQVLNNQAIGGSSAFQASLGAYIPSDNYGRINLLGEFTAVAAGNSIEFLIEPTADDPLYKFIAPNSGAQTFSVELAPFPIVSDNPSFYINSDTEATYVSLYIMGYDYFI